MLEQLLSEQESRRNWNTVINKLELTANNKATRFLAKLHFWKEVALVRARINDRVVAVQHKKLKINGFASNQDYVFAYFSWH